MLTLNRSLVTPAGLVSIFWGLVALLTPLVHAMDGTRLPPLGARHLNQVNQVSQASISSLPQELLSHVYRFSGAREVLELGKVDKKFRNSIIDYFGNSNILFQINCKTIGDDQFITLFSRIGFFSKIKKLDISWSQLNPEMLAYLPKTLTELNLNFVKDLNNDYFKDLAQWVTDRLPHLTSLKLADNEIDLAGTEAIARSPSMGNLTLIDLSFNEVGDNGAKAIAESPYLKNLTSLDLDNNEIGDEGAKAIAESPYLKNLTSLSLRHNRLGTETKELLRNSADLKQLRDANGLHL